MHQRTLCRLCISTCSEFKCLFDDSGQLNKVYEIAVKYFDPVMLTPVKGDDTIVICIECWQYISDFHSFQQTVIQNQSQLKTLKLVVRIEKLTNSMRQSPQIKDEIITSENSVSIFDIVQIQNAATSVVTSGMNYDMMIKGQTIVLQLPSNIVPDTSLDEICGQRQLGTAKLNATSDMDTFSHNHLLLENCRVNHDNKEKDNNIEIDQIESNSFAEIFDDESDGNDDDYDDEDLLNDDQMESNSCAETFDSDQNDNITTDDEFILQHPPISSNHARSNSRFLNFLQKTELKYDKFIAKWRSVIECPLCKSRFKKYSKYCLHFKNEHPLQKCHIICCKRNILHRYSLVEHIRWHLNPSRFKCNICEINLSTKASLKRHLLKLHADKHTREELHHMLQDECKKNMQDDVPKINKCHICETILSTKSSLKRHLVKVHTRTREELYCRAYRRRNRSQAAVINGTQVVVKNDIQNINPCKGVSNDKNLRLDSISSNSGAEGIVTSIASKYDDRVHEIILETQVNVENTINDGDNVCYNEIHLPALEIIDVKEEIQLNYNNNSASDNYK